MEPRKIEKVDIYIDGASRGNPGPASIAGVAIIGDTVVDTWKQQIPRCTNNEAEFKALYQALIMAQKNRWEDINVFTDSRLVANVSNGSWKLRSAPLTIIVNSLRAKVQEIKAERHDGYFKIQMAWVPRTHPIMVDVDRKCNEALNESIF